MENFFLPPSATQRLKEIGYTRVSREIVERCVARLQDGLPVLSLYKNTHGMSSLVAQKTAEKISRDFKAGKFADFLDTSAWRDHGKGEAARKDAFREGRNSVVAAAERLARDYQFDMGYLTRSQYYMENYDRSQLLDLLKQYFMLKDLRDEATVKSRGYMTPDGKITPLPNGLKHFPEIRRYLWILYEMHYSDCRDYASTEELRVAIHFAVLGAMSGDDRWNKAGDEYLRFQVWNDDDAQDAWVESINRFHKNPKRYVKEANEVKELYQEEVLENVKKRQR